jgi:hypothetical protein
MAEEQVVTETPTEEPPPVFAEDKSIAAEPEQPASDTTGNETSQDSEPQPETEQAKGPGLDQALQKFQQRQTVLEQRQAEFQGEITGQLGSISSALESLKSQPAASEPERDAAEAAQEEISTLLSSIGDDDDVPTNKEIKDIIGSITNTLKTGSDPSSNKLVNELRNELTGLREDFVSTKTELQQTKDKQAATAYWLEFKTTHDYDGQPVWQKAVAQAASEFPDDDAQMRHGIAKKIFNDEISRMDTGGSKPPVSASRKSTASASPRSAAGTRTVSEGATGSRAAGTNSGNTKTLPPVYTED